VQTFDEARALLQDKAARGQLATDTAPAVSGHLGLDALHIADGVIGDLEAYRAAVLASSFQTVTVGPLAFHGIAECTDPELIAWITLHYPHAQPRMTFVRQSPAGQVEPHFIHTDRDMGDWSGILYLTAQPAIGDGTSFWRDRETGATASTATSAAALCAEAITWQQPDRWDVWATVKAQPNRLVLFPSTLFHSRAIFDNYGRGEDARLIQVIFGTGSLHRGHA